MKSNKRMLGTLESLINAGIVPSASHEKINKLLAHKKINRTSEIKDMNSKKTSKIIKVNGKRVIVSAEIIEDARGTVKIHMADPDTVTMCGVNDSKNVTNNKDEVTCKSCLRALEMDGDYEAPRTKGYSNRDRYRQRDSMVSSTVDIEDYDSEEHNDIVFDISNRIKEENDRYNANMQDMINGPIETLVERMDEENARHQTVIQELRDEVEERLTEPYGTGLHF
jgi:hypothetical protein